MSDHDDYVPPGHGEEPGEDSLAHCPHPYAEVVNGWVRCVRCGRTLRPATEETDDVHG